MIGFRRGGKKVHENSEPFDPDHKISNQISELRLLNLYFFDFEEEIRAPAQKIGLGTQIDPSKVVAT